MNRKVRLPLLDTAAGPAEGGGGQGGAICPGPQPMKGPQNEEVKQVYNLYTGNGA